MWMPQGCVGVCGCPRATGQFAMSHAVTYGTVAGALLLAQLKYRLQHAYTARSARQHPVQGNTLCQYGLHLTADESARDALGGKCA